MYTDYLLCPINILKLFITPSTKKTIFNMTSSNTKQHSNYKNLIGGGCFPLNKLAAMFCCLNFILPPQKWNFPKKLNYSCLNLNQAFLFIIHLTRNVIDFCPRQTGGCQDDISFPRSLPKLSGKANSHYFIHRPIKSPLFISSIIYEAEYKYFLQLLHLVVPTGNLGSVAWNQNPSRRESFIRVTINSIIYFILINI